MIEMSILVKDPQAAVQWCKDNLPFNSFGKALSWFDGNDQGMRRLSIRFESEEAATLFKLFWSGDTSAHAE